MRYWLVMPAAGVGRRFGQQRPKQYAPLHGRTVIEWALAPFMADARCAGVVVALAAGDPYWPDVARKLARSPDMTHAAPGSGASSAPGSGPAPTPGSAPERHPREVIIAAGGAERSGSVRNALATLGSRAAADDWVLVHDAARPCLSTKDLQQLLTRLSSHPVGGLLATPAADTLKRAALAVDRPQTAPARKLEAPLAEIEVPVGDIEAPAREIAAAVCRVEASGTEQASGSERQAEGPGVNNEPGDQSTEPAGPEVEETVDRARLWRALTPQMFRYGRLCEALDRAAAAGRYPTDEAQALEWLGDRPVLVEGSAANLKITSADDLVLAEALLGARR